MTKYLKIQAGPVALKEIENKGFNQELVKMMLGASGGPKWLILYELDKYLSGEFFSQRNEKLHLLGSSIGSWRFACYAHENPIKALETFKNSYTNFGVEFENKPDAKNSIDLVTKLSFEMLDSFIGKSTEEIDKIIHNPIYKLNFICAASKGILKKENKLLLAIGILGAGIANSLKRNNLKYFFERTLFYSDSHSPFYHINDLPTSKVQLNANNLRNALMASGSIPLVTAGISNIEATNPNNVYRDGGFIDYHFDIEIQADNGIVLYPHFYDHAIPGWFDKFLKSRKLTLKNYERIVMISPSNDLIHKLPFGKIPDRNDFDKMISRDRIKYWNTVADMGKYIADEFHEIINSERILAEASKFKH